MSLTYLLVMRNELLIPSMDHNLIPPFLIQEAGLLLDETPKHQIETPTIDNHTIVNPVTGMRIHLALNGIFSYFPPQCLSPEEMENRDNYPIVFITPGADRWDETDTHYAEQEASMLDSGGVIIECEAQQPSQIFTKADIGKLYAEPVTWSEFDAAVLSIIADKDPYLGITLTNDESVKLNEDGICAMLSSPPMSHCYF
jgi:hypothetical protein